MAPRRLRYLALASAWNRTLVLIAGLLVAIVLVWNYYFGPSTISPGMGEAYSQLSLAGVTGPIVGGALWLTFSALLVATGLVFLNLATTASFSRRLLLATRLLLLATVIGTVCLTAFVPTALMSNAVARVVDLEQVLYQDPVTFGIYVGGAIALACAIPGWIFWVVAYRTARSKRAAD